MIINPIILSTSGGLSPELTVTAPTTSTITITKAGVTIDSYTLSGSETSHTFTLPSTGTYVASAVKGTSSGTQTVLIENVGQYSVTISYKSVQLCEYLETSAADSFVIVESMDINNTCGFRVKCYMASVREQAPMGTSFTVSSTSYRWYVNVWGDGAKWQPGYICGTSWYNNGTVAANTVYDVKFNYLNDSYFDVNSGATRYTLSKGTGTYSDSPIGVFRDINPTYQHISGRWIGRIYDFDITSGSTVIGTYKAGYALETMTAYKGVYDSSTTTWSIQEVTVPEDTAGFYNTMTEKFYVDVLSGSLHSGGNDIDS